MPHATRCTTLPTDPATQDAIRSRLAERAKTLGIQPLARRLGGGVTRAGLQSFLVGRSQRGTAHLVCSAATEFFAAEEKGHAAAE